MACTYDDVCKMFGFFTPSPCLHSATDFYYKILLRLLFWDLPSPPSQGGHHMYMSPYRAAPPPPPHPPTFFHRHGRPRRRLRVAAGPDAVVQVGLGVSSEQLVFVSRGGVAVGQFRERQLFHAGGEGISFQDQLQSVLGGVEKFPVSDACKRNILKMPSFLCRYQ